MGQMSDLDRAIDLRPTVRAGFAVIAFGVVGFGL